MVTERAYGQLKGRWRVLLRKNESEPCQAKTTTLACMVLHNICIEKGDTICSKLDITSDPLTNAKRDSRTLRDALEMTCCRKLPDSNSQATQIRGTLAEMFWREREGSELRWPDWIFFGGYLPSLSINYFAMSKDMEKGLPQMYYIKMKISYDLGFIAIGESPWQRNNAITFFTFFFCFSVPGVFLRNRLREFVPAIIASIMSKFEQIL